MKADSGAKADRVWFVTGASNGFGQTVNWAVLARPGLRRQSGGESRERLATTKNKRAGAIHSRRPFSFQIEARDGESAVARSLHPISCRNRAR